MTHHPYDDIDHTMILAMRRGCSLADSALLAHFTRGPSRASHLRDALKYADMIAEAAKVLRDEMTRADVVEDASRRARAMNAELPADQRDALELKGAI